MKSSPINPYAAGILLGLVLTASYALLGTGLGASSGPARIMASFCRGAQAQNGYFVSLGAHPMHYYLVFMFFGVLLGGGASAWISGRSELTLERGGACPGWLRFLFVLAGGFLVGLSARIAGGCTSGQALSGGALMLNGGLVFMVFVFLGGFASAALFRRQWND